MSSIAEQLAKKIKDIETPASSLDVKKSVEELKQKMEFTKSSGDQAIVDLGAVKKEYEELFHSVHFPYTNIIAARKTLLPDSRGAYHPTIEAEIKDLEYFLKRGDIGKKKFLKLIPQN